MFWFPLLLEKKLKYVRENYAGGCLANVSWLVALFVHFPILILIPMAVIFVQAHMIWLWVLKPSVGDTHLLGTRNYGKLSYTNEPVQKMRMLEARG